MRAGARTRSSLSSAPGTCNATGHIIKLFIPFLSLTRRKKNAFLVLHQQARHIHISRQLVACKSRTT